MKKISTNFILGKEFSNKEFNQSDFGHIYFNLPSQTVSPKTTAELAQTLRNYHKKGTKVTIRNTGHSANGQTLTSGVQINVGNIKKLHFDKEKMLVTLGCGNSWDDLFKVIALPNYCPPVFPNNPNQEIKIGGTASVGGMGLYSSHNGGFWNYVESLKLVTMTGEIINCSKEENQEYYSFALAGFGRIGVISELTVKVEPSKKYIFSCVLMYPRGGKNFHSDLESLINDSEIDGVIVSEQTGPPLSSVDYYFPIIVLIFELDENDNPKEKLKYIKDNYHENFLLLLDENDQIHHFLDIALRPKKIPKKDFVYWYPQSLKQSPSDLSHPWSEYIIPKEDYFTFVNQTKIVLHKYDFSKYLIKEACLRNHVDTTHIPCYLMKKMSIDSSKIYPLSLDLKNSSYSFGVTVMPTVPASEIEKSLQVIKELTDLAYELGGKRYLYGIHNLTKAQVEKQFSRGTIDKWQKIKDRLDPKHLLNIGVIEHLD